MSNIRWSIGVDVSTQTITAMLLGVMEKNNAPFQLLISSELSASRTCSEITARRNPSVWVELFCECINELKLQSADVERVEGVGISTTFPGTFPVLSNGNIVPDLVRLYDDADDAGILSGTYEELLGKVEDVTLNRVWPGCMLIGISNLVKCEKLDLRSLSAIVPPNTALAYQLLRISGFDVSVRTLFSDFSQTAISCVYDARSFEPLPDECLELLSFIYTGFDWSKLKWLLPDAKPSWRNIVPGEAMERVRKLLELPNLKSISIGAGDSALGNLALSFNKTRIINVRGSSDTPIIIVNKLKKKECRRETLLHYPLPSMHKLNYSNWCAAAPMLRSGRVWDWVKALRYSPDDAHADCELEELAIKALKRRLKAPANSLEARQVIFDTSLGGERAPDWDSNKCAAISNLTISHDIGDIALAALEGLSMRLRRCIEMIESRYDVHPDKMLLAGGPVRNQLWNWLTQVYTGKQTEITSFSDASLLGAAMLGYAASFDETENDEQVANRLETICNMASKHSLISPKPVVLPKMLSKEEAEFYEKTFSKSS